MLAGIEKGVANKPTTADGTREEDRQWLLTNAEAPGIVQLPSGLQYRPLRNSEPDADSPKVETPCECHYRGTLLDGSEFDSSFRREKAVTLLPNKMIPALTIALQLMGVGDKWQLFIPSELAYGDAGRADCSWTSRPLQHIPAGAALHYELELLAVNGPPKPKPVRPKAMPNHGAPMARTDSSFVPCKRFAGYKPGMIFTTREEGTGYYNDVGVGGAAPPVPAALLLDKALRLDSPEMRRAPHNSHQCARSSRSLSIQSRERA
jgi:FKBP-type peptidyl-prolyl cis-trans isomerase FklB